ncbi:MAG: TonB-dependent receptor [Flavobacteriaceae bacterium]|jgi:iron complex outermembrane receptor protein|nr:TonB-dependent receptor [Flavobacteriaceae bacterium]
MKKITGVFFIFFFFILLHAQSQCLFTLTGKITDTHSGKPLEYAKVSLTPVDGEEIYSVSNEEGTYVINTICPGDYVIRISHPECISGVFRITITLDMIRDFSLESGHQEKEIQEIITTGKTQTKTKTSVENKLSKTRINTYSDTNLGTALSSIAGISTLRTGNNIVKPVIHGLHSSRVPVLNNGIRQEDQQWGVEHAPDIDLNVANSVSVIKGAGALQYAGDATGGIVLVEPGKLTFKDTLSGSVLTSYLSNGSGGNISANLEKGWKKGWALRLQGTYKKAGDLSAPDYNLSNTGLKENDFSIQFGYRKKNFGMEGFYSYFGSETGILKAAHIGNLENLVNAVNSRKPLIIQDFTVKIDAPKQEIQHNLAKLNTYYNLSFGTFSLVYGYQFNNRKEYDIRRSSFMDKASLDLDLTTHNLNMDFEHAAFKGFSGKAGISYVYQKNIPNAGTGVNPLIPYYRKDNFGIYWIENVKLTRFLTLEGGFRYDYQKVDALKFYKKNRWSALGYDKKHPDIIIKDTGLSYLVNPVLKFNGYAATLGAAYKLGATNDITLNYSLSSRAPNPGELFSDGLHHSAAAIELGDLNLKNEKSNKIISTFRSRLLDYRLSLELSAYYNYIKDFINQIPTGAEYNIRGAFPVWQYLQTNAEIYGIDIMAEYNLTPDLILATNFSYLKGNDTKNKVALINMPPVRWVNTIEYKNSRWMNFFAKLSSISVLKQTRYPDYNFVVEVVEGGKIVSKLLDISTPPPAYQLFDFNTGFSLHVTQQNKLDISFGVRNILNTSYRDYLNRLRFYADETGRNFIVKIQYNF